MNNRLKHLRKSLDLTQQEFADRIGIKRNTVATYESGRNAPIDAVLNLICREFNVNRDWLETGDGEMFCTLSKDQELANFIGSLFGENVCPEKRQYIESLSRLPDEWFIQTMNSFKRYEK